MTAADTEASVTTYAALVWPAKAEGWSKPVRAVILVLLGAAFLTLSAKIQVPGPVPMTLQTLAVLALGAMLGFRLATLSVLLYLAEGALGWPVFANTPPLAPGLGYLLGPTGGFLLGFVLAAGISGTAADRGIARRPLLFAGWLATASAAMLAMGWLWLALVTLPAGSFVRAFEMGIRPFLLGEGIKLALAAVSLPLALDGLRRLLGR
ncbi:biotin transporter BioY [uncultured Enterovirga sp.]|uniref:biotin transporter BioY n=1 Tax=uncultured Enterovirga sp. TaxID=2026352 RepID=UPI0035C9B6E6